MMPFYKNRFNDFPFCQVWKGRQLESKLARWEWLLLIFQLRMKITMNNGSWLIFFMHLHHLEPRSSSPGRLPAPRWQRGHHGGVSWVMKCLHWMSLLTSQGSHGSWDFSLIIQDKITFSRLTSLPSVSGCLSKKITLGSEMRIVLIVNNLKRKIYLREINWRNGGSIKLSNLWNFKQFNECNNFPVSLSCKRHRAPSSGNHCVGN